MSKLVGKRKGVVSLLLVALMVCVLVVPAASALASMRANPTDPAADVRLDNPGDDVVETRCAVTGDRVFEFADGSRVTVIHYSPASIVLAGGGPIKCERNANVKADIVLQLIRPSPVTTLNIDAEVVAAGEQVAQSEVDQARRVGQAWVEKIAITVPAFAEWKGAQLTSPQPYYNPRAERIAYMFAIEKDGNTVGHVLIGSSAYGFPIFAAAKGPPFQPPAASAVSSILRSQHGLEIPEERIGDPRFVLLDILRGFYATWELEGQVAGINLITGDSFTRPNLEMLKSVMPSPLEYKAAKRVTSQSLPEPVWGGVGLIRDAHLMVAWEEIAPDLPENQKLWCGPASGLSIVAWKRDADGDVNLDTCNVTMFNLLYHFMQTGDHWPGATLPGLYGPGFVAYGNFRDEHFEWTYRHTYAEIISDIDNSWPLALLGNIYIPWKGQYKLHWVGIKGYMMTDFMAYGVIVTDSAYPPPGNDARLLCWAAIDAGFNRQIRIKDWDD